MTQIFFPDELNTTSKKLYCYTNCSDKVVIARLLGIPERECERVVFPKESFLFEAPLDSELELTQFYSTNIVKEIIPCTELIVKE